MAFRCLVGLSFFLFYRVVFVWGRILVTLVVIGIIARLACIFLGQSLGTIRINRYKILAFITGLVRGCGQLARLTLAYFPTYVRLLLRAFLFDGAFLSFVLGHVFRRVFCFVFDLHDFVRNNHTIRTLVSRDYGWCTLYNAHSARFARLEGLRNHGNKIVVRLRARLYVRQASFRHGAVLQNLLGRHVGKIAAIKRRHKILGNARQFFVRFYLTCCAINDARVGRRKHVCTNA